MTQQPSTWQRLRPWAILLLLVFLVVEAVVISKASRAPSTQSLMEETQILMDGFLKADPQALQILVNGGVDGLTAETATAAMGPNPTFSIQSQDHQDADSVRSLDSSNVTRFLGTIITDSEPVEVTVLWTRRNEYSPWIVKPFKLSTVSLLRTPGVYNATINGFNIDFTGSQARIGSRTVFPGKLTVQSPGVPTIEKSLSTLTSDYRKDEALTQEESTLRRTDQDLTPAQATTLVQERVKKCLGAVSGPVDGCPLSLPDPPRGSTDVRNVVFSGLEVGGKSETLWRKDDKGFVGFDAPSYVHGSVLVKGQWKVNGAWTNFSTREPWNADVTFDHRSIDVSIDSFQFPQSRVAASWADAHTDFGPSGSPQQREQEERKRAQNDKNLENGLTTTP